MPAFLLPDYTAGYKMHTTSRKRTLKGDLALTNATMGTENVLNQQKIIMNLLETFKNCTAENRNEISENLSKVLQSSNIALSPITSAALLKFLKKVCSDRSPIDDSNLKACISSILKREPIINLIKHDEKLLSDIFISTLNIHTPSSEDCCIYLSLCAIYQSLSNREAVLLSFVRKSMLILGHFYSRVNRHMEDSIDGLLYKQRTIQFTQSILFNKGGMAKLSLLLKNLFEKKEGKCVKFTSLFKVLYACHECDMETESKAALFQLVLEALMGMESVSDNVIVRFIILYAHILGIEQTVLVTVDGQKRQLLEADHIKSIFQADATFNKSSLTIWKTIIDLVSTRSVNLSEEILGVTGVQWFQALVQSLLTKRGLNHNVIGVLSSLFLLDSLIIEPFMSQIFKKIYAKSCKLSQSSFLAAYDHFMLTALRTFSRLQRLHKFLAKFLLALSSSEGIDSEKLLSHTFLENVSSTMIGLPSAHGLSLITSLLDQLEKIIENFSQGEISTTHMQVVGYLLAATMSSCRLLCYTLPRTVVESFLNLMDRLRSLLARFGNLILLRPHDQKIMQPFLRVCLVWGEIQILIACYSSEDGSPNTCEDSSPADLSPVLTFISGEQWSVYAERITNFGDQECNRYLMKLILQKLKLSQLAGKNNLMNSETTAKYLFMRLKTEIHGMTVINAMEPEELNIILNWLSGKESEALMDLFYKQVEHCDRDTFNRWVEDPLLLENKKFVISLFEAAFRSIVELIPEENVSPCRENLLQALRKVALAPLSKKKSDLLKKILDEALDTEIPETTKTLTCDRLEKAYFAFKHLPLSYLTASYGGAPLTIITALMVATNNTELLLPIFESLLLSTEDVSSCLNIGLCIKWVMIQVGDRTLRASLIETLVIKSMVTEVGVNQFKLLVKSFKKSSHLVPDLEMKVILYNAIRKCWGQGKRSEEKNTMLAGQRKTLVRRLRSSMEEAATDENCSNWAILDAFALLLMIQERKGKVQKVVDLNFTAHLKKALAGAKEGLSEGNVEKTDACLNFLTAVLKCSTALRSVVKDDFVYSIWQELNGIDCEKLWCQVSIAATNNEYKKIMDDISTKVKNSLLPPLCEDTDWEGKPPLPKRLRPLFIRNRVVSQVWPCSLINTFRIFAVNALGRKLVLWRNSLETILKQTDCIIPKCDDNGANLLNWLQFLQFVASNKKVMMTSQIQDYLIDVILAAPTEGVSFLEHFNIRTDILISLIGPKSPFFREKVHLLFQAFKKLLDWLVRESDTSLKLAMAEESDRALAAYHLEKWTSVFIQRDVGRELSLFIVEIITYLTTVSLLVPVKMHLNNAIFILLRLADEHTVQFILRILPTGSQHIFTDLFGQFRRFYKYKGKI